MLSDRDRETLREIQRQLVIDDPAFERSFRAAAVPLPRDHRRLTFTIVIVLAALLGTVMVLAGSPGGALAFAVIAGLAWYARHRRGNPNQRQEH